MSKIVMIDENIYKCYSSCGMARNGVTSIYRGFVIVGLQYASTKLVFMLCPTCVPTHAREECVLVFRFVDV